MTRAALLVVLLAGCGSVPPPTLWVAGDVHPGRAEALTEGLELPGPGVVNLEGPIAAAPVEGPGLRLVNPPGTAGRLFAAGVRVVGVANNHAEDAGATGRGATVRALQGAGLRVADGARTAFLRVGEAKIAITQHDLTRGVPESLARDLMAAARNADHLVALFHVTGPASYLPRPELKQAVEVAVRSGARAVAAHGTHALGPVERRDGAVIAWGLGNLVFDCPCTEESEAAVLQLWFDEEGVERAALVPVQAGLGGAAARAAPDAAGIYDLVDGLGGTKLRRDEGRAWF